MAGNIRNILCRAFVAPGSVTVNALVTYSEDTMELVCAQPFEYETASTSHFDGIVINGLPMENAELKISVSDFRARLAEIAGSISESRSIILVPLC